MMHRKMNEENRNNNFINVKNLNLSKFKDEIEQLISLQTGEDKLLYITTYLENNIQPFDIFSNLFFIDENEQLNDLTKYYLIFLLSLLNKEIMKEVFPDMKIKNNNIIVSQEKPLMMSKKLFQIFFSLLFHSKIKEIQYTLIELLLCYADMSDDFVDYCLEDIRYINKLFQLTYSNINDIVNTIILILDIILKYKDCDNDQLEKIIQNISIIERCKELLCGNNFNNDIRINTLEILETISDKINRDYFKNYFMDFINIFYNLIALQAKNEELIMIVFRIISKIAYDDDICKKIKESGMAYILYQQYLSTPNIERNFLLVILKIFSNLFYLDEIITFFIYDKNGEILKVFTRIINTYINTSNEKDNYILKEIIYCLSNLATGPCDTKAIISNSDLPKLIAQIMKIKNDNNIYYEGVHFFNNMIDECNKETFYNISELNPFKIYAKGLGESFEIENLELCLKAIINLINKNREFYHTTENLKKYFYTCMIKKKIDDLTLHKNKDISTKAETIVRYFEDKMNME